MKKKLLIKIPYTLEELLNQQTITRTFIQYYQCINKDIKFSWLLSLKF